MAREEQDQLLNEKYSRMNDAYHQGDKVTFEGEHYISLIDNNVWSPKDYPQGWQKAE